MNGACHDGAASTLGSAPILSVLVAAPTQENEMSRSLRGLALPAAALLALALGAVSPAVADTPSGASSPEPSTYTTPAKPGVDVAEAPTPAAPQADAAAEDPAEPATSPAADPTADPDAESAADPAAEPAPAEAPPAPQPATGTWVRDAAGWKYVDVDGSAVTNQVKEIDGTTYAFDATGHVARGWWRDAEGRWYLSSDYGVRTGWQRDGANWYYLDSFGVMHTGWLVEGGAWFYFHSTGAMATGWLHDGAHWYHLSNTGAMTQGWLHLGDWYYLDPVQGGAMATGWLGIGGHWNYFDAWDGFWVSDRDSFAADWEYARTLYSPTNYLLVVDTSAPHCMSFYWPSTGATAPGSPTTTGPAPSAPPPRRPCAAPSPSDLADAPSAPGTRPTGGPSSTATTSSTPSSTTRAPTRSRTAPWVGTSPTGACACGSRMPSGFTTTSPRGPTSSCTDGPRRRVTATPAHTL